VVAGRGAAAGLEPAPQRDGGFGGEAPRARVEEELRLRSLGLLLDALEELACAWRAAQGFLEPEHVVAEALQLARDVRLGVEAAALLVGVAVVAHVDDVHHARAPRSSLASAAMKASSASSVLRSA
jgi:hypothetical protein